MSGQGLAGVQLSETARGAIMIWLAQAPLPLSTDTAAIRACERLAKAVTDPARLAAEMHQTALA